MTVLHLWESGKKDIDNNCILVQCLFINLNGVERGAAIYKNGAHRVDIIASFFIQCSARVFGGSISLEEGSIYYSNSCAELCNLTYVKDNNYGNHLFCDKQNEAFLVNSEAFQCGSNDMKCGDSVIMAFESNIMKAKNLNHSHCSTFGGTTGISVGKPTVNELDYITVYKGRTAHLHALHYPEGHVLVKHTIAVGTYFTSAMISANTESYIEISDSILLPAYFKRVFSSNYHKILGNVYGNFTFNGVIPLSSYDIEYQKKRKGCTLINTKMKGKSKSGFLQNIILISVILTKG